jgi:hypothetical protein
VPHSFRVDLVAGVGNVILETEQGRQAFTEPGDQYRCEVEGFARQVPSGSADDPFRKQSRLTLAATRMVADAAGLQ